MNKAFEGIGTSFNEYLIETCAISNQARYNQGKLIFNIAGLFIGVTEANALIKGETTLLKVVQASLKSYAAIPKSVAKLMQRASNSGLAYVALKTGNKSAYLAYKLANTEVTLAEFTIDKAFDAAKLINTTDGVVLEILENVPYIDEFGNKIITNFDVVEKDADVFLRVSGAGNVIDDFIANVSKYDDVIEKSASELTQAEKVLKESFEQADDVGSFTQRTAQDIKYEQYRATKGSGTATKPDFLNRNIGTLTEPNQIKDGFCTQLKSSGATDIRVNQSQTLTNGNAVGINRPDIQFTYGGKRYHIEIDAAASNRGVPHKNRIISNDPSSANLTLPTALQNISVTVNGKTHTLSGGITLIQL